MSSEDVIGVVSELRVLTSQEEVLLKKVWPLRSDENGLKEVIQGKEEALAALLIKAALSVHTDHVKREILRAMATFCRDIPSFAKALSTSPASKDLVMQSLTASSDVGLLCVAHILRLNNGLTDFAPGFLRQTLTIFESAPREPQGSQKDVEGALKALAVYLRRKELRESFVRTGGLPHLPALLQLYCVSDMATNAQLLYDILFCCWLTLFDPNAVDVLHKRKIIPIVHDVLKRSVKEKVIRVALLNLEVLLSMQARYQTGDEPTLSVMSVINNNKGPRFYTDMSGIGMLKTIQTLQKRNWEDHDVVEKLENLEKKLQENLEDLTTFSEYLGEVHSGVLEWSPAHTSVKFWKENLKQFEVREFEVLRQLGELLKASTHEVTLAVACYDFGEFIRHHPQGRKILTLPQFAGVKERILTLMSHSSPEVQRHALLSTQKIMVQRREFLGGRD